MSGFGDRRPFWSSNPAPAETTTEEATWKDFGTSMNAISFGFVATAILISMFLIMAIVEHLFRPRTSFLIAENGQAQAQMYALEKIRSSQPVASSCPPDLSVMMPGDRYPTYIAQPAPFPCTREGICWPSHDHRPFTSSV
ncbi:uncharacterized protein LOC109823905 isoform X2 [Asparagus officinalis]|nr:uncharacterized protein LOC109823905 isoform X2 [Asparagus officinalis]XP_020245939.1 uncharacterized protein LOC109823905 isoform X2 [Asparagus officinalis]XP_020245940.1 uncharacterized protein LOC109823905 isoform X2 [Asparagus officinalis]XP_020245941.1 uncharacterized protein LOC109823905 isoform X2 [Asparagus officinalis]XP_020245942.1 uncharacterized protein LOC109823905 isoform X2 [Asparagus officinalis]